MKTLVNSSFSIALICLGLSACTKKQAEPGASLPETKEVSLAIWGNYIAPELLEKFTASTGVKVKISNYSSNEELLAKVQMGRSQIDLAVPSDYMVEIMIKMGLLETLRKDLLPNHTQLDPQLLQQPYDATNTYSVPTFGQRQVSLFIVTFTKAP